MLVADENQSECNPAFLFILGSQQYRLHTWVIRARMEDKLIDPLSPWKEGNFNLKYFWFVCVSVTALATSLANTLVVVAVWRDPNRNLQRIPANFLIVSQAVADFFVGLILEPLSCWWLLTFSSAAAHAMEALSSLFLVSSLLHMVAISYDRHIAVVKPLLHSVKITRKRVLVLDSIMWLYSAIYMVYRTALRALNISITTLNIISGFHTVLPSLGCALIYLHLYLVLRKHRKNARKLDESGRIVINAYARERKMTKAMFMLLVLFLFCLTPWFIFYQVIDACPTCEENRSMEMYLFSVFYYLFMLRALINPFVFAWRLPKYRSAFKLLVKRLTSRNRVEEGS